jgi:hypothetical protein
MHIINIFFTDKQKADKEKSGYTWKEIVDLGIKTGLKAPKKSKAVKDEK